MTTHNSVTYGLNKTINYDIYNCIYQLLGCTINQTLSTYEIASQTENLNDGIISDSDVEGNLINTVSMPRFLI